MTKDEALKMSLDAMEGADMIDCDMREAMTAILEALAQPEQEPVTWRYKIVDVFGRPVWTLKTPKSDTRVLESQPLYTTPPQRKPLTDEEINRIAKNYALSNPTTPLHFARAIEAAHGIKGET